MPRGELHRLRHALDARATHAHTYKQTQTRAHDRARTHKGTALFHIVLTSIMIHSLKSVGQDGITARHLAPFNVTKRMCGAAARSQRRNWIIHAVHAYYHGKAKPLPCIDSLIHLVALGLRPVPFGAGVISGMPMRARSCSRHDGDGPIPG